MSQRTHRASGVALLLMLSACRSSTRAPTPRAPRDAGGAPSDAPRPRRLRREDLPLPTARDAAAPPGVASLSVDGEGLAVLLRDPLALRVLHLRGSRWEAMGEALNASPPRDAATLSAAPDGRAAALWAEAMPSGATEVRFARWGGRRWEPLPGPLNAPDPRETVTQVALAWSDGTPVAAMMGARSDRSGSSLRAVWWTGARWENAGPPSLIAASGRAQALAAATCGDGSAVLAWVEVSALGVATLELRRWDMQARTWRVIHRGNAPPVDGETHALSLVGAAGADFFIAYDWSQGAHAPQRWDANTRGWIDLGLPRPALRTTRLEAGPLVTSRGDWLWLVWRAPNEGLSAAQLRAGRWSALSDPLDRPGGVDPRVGIDARGTLFASWRAEAGPAVAAFRLD